VNSSRKMDCVCKTFIFPSYDDAGNMMRDNNRTNHTCNQKNRITGAASYTYTVVCPELPRRRNADGNRVEKSNGSTGTIYWYMSPGIVAESDLSGNLKSEYVFFKGERVARKDFTGTTTPVSYYFSDHLKTASVITNSAGTITEDEDYYPWGGELQSVNSDSNHYKFGGHERDSETSLDNFGARYYANWTGRFLTPDAPFADQNAANPQSWNLYSYTRNNPVSCGDADGRKRSVCDTGGKNCVGVEDSDWNQFLKDHNLRDGGGGNLYYLNPDGSFIKSGTVEYVPDNSIAGAAMIANGAGGWIPPADRAIGHFVNHPVGQAIFFMFAFDAGGAAEGTTGAEEGAAEGAAEEAPFMTQWGWNGSKPYTDAVKQLKQTGTHESLSGKIPTREEATRMIQEGGGKVVRSEGDSWGRQRQLA